MPAPIQSSSCPAAAPHSGIWGFLCCKQGTCHACSELPAPCLQPVRLWRTLRPPSGCMESCGPTASAQTARCTLPSSQRAAGASKAVLATSAGGHLLRVRQARAQLGENQHRVAAASQHASASLNRRACFLHKASPKLSRAEGCLQEGPVLSGGIHAPPLCMAMSAPHALPVFVLLQECRIADLSAGVTSWCCWSRPRRCSRTCRLPACAQTQPPGTP